MDSMAQFGHVPLDNFLSLTPLKSLKRLHLVKSKAGRLKGKLLQMPDMQNLKRQLIMLTNKLNEENANVSDYRLQALLIELENLELYLTDMTENLEDIKSGIDMVLGQQENSQSQLSLWGQSSYSNTTEDNENHEDAGEFMTDTPQRHDGKQVKMKRHQKCEICQRRFLSKSAFDMHIELHKTREELYKCNICELIYKTKGALEIHENNSHEGSYFMRKGYNKEDKLPMICDVCGKFSVSRGKLRDHMRCHIGRNHTEILSCKICDAKFKSFFERDAHYHSHTEEDLSWHSITLDTRVCDICGLILRKRHLEQHKSARHSIPKAGDRSKNLCTEDRSKNLWAEDRPKNLCTEDGRKILCAEDGLKNLCSEDVPKNLCAEDGSENLCAEDGPKDLCTEDGQKNLCAEDRPKNLYGEGGPIDLYAEDEPINLCTGDGRKNRCTEDQPKNPFAEDRHKNVCNDCGKISDSLKEHTDHMKCHEGDRIKGQRKPFFCKICHMKFKRAATRFTHYRSHTSEELSQHNIILDTGVCDICGFVTRSSYVKTHKILKHPNSNQESQTNFVCEICGKVLGNKVSHRNHMYKHNYYAKQRLRPPDSYPCEICGKVFRSKVNLKFHLLSHKIKQGEAVGFMCQVCGKGFTHKRYLLIHEIRHNKNQGEVSLKRFKCGVCEKAFPVKSYLRQHMRIHTGDRPYHCEICDKRFSFKSSLNAHMQCHRSETSCHICGKKFTLPCNLARHISAVHQKIKNFQCSFCDKSFSTRRGRDCHENIHTGNKPFACDRCDLKFKDQSTLYKHRARHQDQLISTHAPGPLNLQG